MLANYYQSVRLLLARADSKPYALAALAADALAQAGLVAAVEPGSVGLLRLVRLGAQAGAALFALARAGGASLELPLGSDEPKTLSGKPEPGEVGVSRWLDAFWAARIVGDGAAVGRLCETRSDELRRSPAKSDEFAYALVDALAADAASDAAAARAHLATATKKTDPESLRFTPVDRVEELHVPVIAALGRLFEGDAVGFDAALRMAFEAHDRYWSEGERRLDPAGFLALAPAALVVMGRARGLVASVTSDYAPPALVGDG